MNFILKDILKTTSDIVNSALVVIEGESRSPEDAIETIGKQKKDKKDCKETDSESEEKMLQVGLYVPCVRLFPFSIFRSMEHWLFIP